MKTQRSLPPTKIYIYIYTYIIAKSRENSKAKREANTQWIKDWLDHSGLPMWLSSKESACQQSRHALHPWVGIWRKKWLPTPVFLLGESHGQRSLAGYSPLGYKESDTTEQLTQMKNGNQPHVRPCYIFILLIQIFSLVLNMLLKKKVCM